MSASILWRPIGDGKHIPGIMTPSAFITALSLPRTFTVRDFEFLEGVKAGNPAWAEAVKEIQDAVIAHGEIEVFPEY